MLVSDEGRFSALYESHYSRVRSYCRRRTVPERVDDVVAETFLTAWRKLDQVPPEPDTLPWLYSVAYGALLNNWRSGARSRRLAHKLRTIGVQPLGSVDEVVVVREQVAMALEAARRLRPKDLEVLRLAVWEELPQSQISVVLGISHGAVRQRLLRARAQLLEEYEKMERRGMARPLSFEGGAP